MAGNIVTTSNLISAVPCILHVEEPVGHHDPTAGEVDLDDRVLHRRYEVLDRALPADPDVVRRPLQDLCDRAEALARARDHREPHDLMVVELARLERAHVLVWNLEVSATEELGHGSVLDAAELDHKARLTFAAPFHLVGGTVDQ